MIVSEMFKWSLLLHTFIAGVTLAFCVITTLIKFDVNTFGISICYLFGTLITGAIGEKVVKFVNIVKFKIFLQR